MTKNMEIAKPIGLEGLDVTAIVIRPPMRPMTNPMNPPMNPTTMFCSRKRPRVGQNSPLTSDQERFSEATGPISSSTAEIGANSSLTWKKYIRIKMGIIAAKARRESHHISRLPSTTAIDAKTATIQRTIGVAVMRAVNAKEPMSDPIRLRVIAHASLNVSFLPTVIWETVAASRPVRMLVPANVTIHCTKFEIICRRRTLDRSVIDWWSAWGS